MKNILIVGKGSYIGESLKQYLATWPQKYSVSTMETRDIDLDSISFKGYDALFHVAGIVHQKETAENEKLYYKINHQFAVDVANKAKLEGVKQFIFLSSGTIYGFDSGMITPTTPINAKTNYGKSKAMAEEDLKRLDSNDFKVAILRPLMVYGKGCKGNFQTVVKLVEKLPVFPAVHNERSLIYIDNLSSFVKMTVDKELSGTYFPRNKENADIYVMTQEIAKALNKKIYMSVILGFGVSVTKNLFGVTSKAFGDKVYINTEEFNYDYCVVSFKDSIKKSI